MNLREKGKRKLRWSILILPVIFISGCASSSVGLSPSSTPTKTVRPTAVNRPTPDFSPTPKPTAVPTPIVALDTLSVLPASGYTGIYSAVEGAKSNIDLVMYELEDSTFEGLLVSAQDRGVKVEVILDQAYAKSQNEDAYNYLNGHGVSVHWSSNQVDITHQKTLIVDKSIAYIMSGNLTPQYYSGTRDFIVEDTDSKDVSAIISTFNSDYSNQEVIPSNGDDLVWSPNSAPELVSIINSAKNELLIENEEMSDPTIVSALEGAAKRGVNVNVCMTESSSWNSYFAELVKAGVHVRTYASNASLYIHAKVILMDPASSNAEAFVGSENFSDTSLDKNRELGIVLNNLSIITQLNGILVDDFNGAQVWTTASS